jgi:hypothetical protein
LEWLISGYLLQFAFARFDSRAWNGRSKSTLAAQLRLQVSELAFNVSA